MNNTYHTKQLKDTLTSAAERLDTHGIDMSEHEVLDELALLAQQIILTGRRLGIHITFHALEQKL